MKGVTRERKEKLNFKLLMLFETKKWFPYNKAAAASLDSKFTSRGERGDTS